MADRSAKHLIIGGGIIGCSIAYHLSRAGEKDVVVLEKAAITEGATWHAAGLVGQLRSSRNTTRMLKKSVELYDRLEAETGMAFDWKKVGSLRLAATKDRLLEVKRLATIAQSFDLGSGPINRIVVSLPV
ncbi:MAG: FAD-dependent oxidoreductase [Allgaiera sp.]|jgi:sarcosine dehydrogenase|nr:FAD-dependent oxidoreductase [Allgaiera sp.]